MKEESKSRSDEELEQKDKAMAETVLAHLTGSREDDIEYLAAVFDGYREMGRAPRSERGTLADRCREVANEVERLKYEATATTLRGIANTLDIAKPHERSRT